MGSSLKDTDRFLKELYLEKIKENLSNNFVKCEDCQEMYGCNDTARGGCTNGKPFPLKETKLEKNKKF